MDREELKSYQRVISRLLVPAVAFDKTDATALRPYKPDPRLLRAVLVNYSSTYPLQVIIPLINGPKLRGLRGCCG